LDDVEEDPTPSAGKIASNGIAGSAVKYSAFWDHPSFLVSTAIPFSYASC
jgi:hypothetical protein